MRGSILRTTGAGHGTGDKYFLVHLQGHLCLPESRFQHYDARTSEDQPK